MKLAPNRFHKVGSLDQFSNGGTGLVFNSLNTEGGIGFVVLFNNTPYAYKNSCPHTGAMLDWQRGDFFEESGKFLICSTHGAIFDPQSGVCVNGPCINQRLIRLPLELRNNDIYVAF